MTEPRSFAVEIGRGAEADLREIAAYLAEHYSAEAAHDFITALLDRIAALEHFPARGSVPKELELIGRREYRQIVSGQYRIIYRIKGERVIVALIAHGRRDMQALLRTRLFARPPD